MIMNSFGTLYEKDAYFAQQSKNLITIIQKQRFIVPLDVTIFQTKH